jgi:hypothetical protein
MVALAGSRGRLPVPAALSVSPSRAGGLSARPQLGTDDSVGQA